MCLRLASALSFSKPKVIIFNRIIHMKVYLCQKFDLANEELKEKRKVEITHNDLCTLENEVRIDA